MIFTSDALASKRIAVTGASSGLGRATAIMLAETGAELVLFGRDEQRLQETMSRLPSGPHMIGAGEISGIDAMHEQLVAATKGLAPLDGVFHAAGTSALRATKILSDAHVQSMFGASVNGAMGIAKACAKRAVMNDAGCIVFMSSVAAIRGRAGMVAYSAAKSAMQGLTRALAAEFAPRRIRVNEVIAGAVETEMHEQIIKGLDESGVDAYRARHPLGFGRPADIAAMITFLMTDASAWVTGASVAVDGGYSIV